MINNYYKYKLLIKLKKVKLCKKKYDISILNFLGVLQQNI